MPKMLKGAKVDIMCLLMRFLTFNRILLKVNTTLCAVYKIAIRVLVFSERMWYNIFNMNNNKCYSKEIGDTALAPKHCALGLPGSCCVVSPYHLEMMNRRSLSKSVFVFFLDKQGKVWYNRDNMRNKRLPRKKIGGTMWASRRYALWNRPLILHGIAIPFGDDEDE